MRKLLSLFFGALTLAIVPSAYALDEPEHLQYSFRINCEDSLIQDCDPKDIGESPDEFTLENFSFNEPMSIDLVVDNPNREPISSAKAKLKYDPLMLDVVRIDTNYSDFDMTAPGEDEIDQNEGTAVIGMGMIGQARTDEELTLATFRITPIAPNAMLEFMNFQNSEVGDTVVIYVNNGMAENMLKNEPKPLIFGAGGMMGGIGGDGNGVRLPAPEGLRIQTDEQGNVRLIWPIGEKPPVEGYYLYYSQQGGYNYLRRRDVGHTNFALFPDLPRGEQYYFSITAYDFEGNESPNSEEVSVVVGQLGSESHPFEGDPQNPEQPTDEPEELNEPEEPEPTAPDETPDTGPAHILFFVLMCMGGASIVYSLKRRT
jgi:hypothetical protein